MKILVIQSTQSGVYYHRQFTPHYTWLDSGDEFQQDGVVIVEDNHIGKLKDVIDNNAFDIVQYSVGVVIPRDVSMFIDFLKFRDNAKFILDIDDRYPRRAKHVFNSIAVCDAITTTCDYLGQYYIDNGVSRPLEVIENGIDSKEKQWEPTAQPKELMFGYVGSTKHEDDLKEMRYNFDSRKLYVVCEEYKEILNVDKAAGLGHWKDYAKHYDPINVSLAPIVNNPFNKSKCIVGDSLVSTNKGILKIKDIFDKKLKVKTEISSNKNNVINYFHYKKVPTIKLKMYGGYEIEGTPHHKIKVNGKWKMLSEFSGGDKIELTPPTILQKKYQEMSFPMLLTKNMTEEKLLGCKESMIPKITLNEDWGRFLGYILGDGSWSGTGISISCHKKHTNVIADVKSLMVSIGLNPKGYEKKVDSRCETSIIKEGNAYDIKATCVTFSKIAIKYGFRNNKGKKLFEIPDIILQSPESVIRQFVKGLFEADGTVGKNNGVSFTTKSEKLARQVQYLLLCMGMQTTFRKPHYNKIYKRHYYSIYLCRYASEIYAKKIGFISKHKKEKLKILTTGRRSNNSKPMSFSSTVRRIEHNINDVYDIEVDNIHEYNANGIVNHNSNLKIIEAGFKKRAIITSKIPPYNRDESLYPAIDLIPKRTSWKERIESYTVEEAVQRGEELFKLVQPYEVRNLNKKRRDFYERVMKI